MRITVEDAHTLAAALSKAADAAQEAGKPDFELLDTLSALDDAARSGLVAAIAQAEQTSGGN